MCIGVSTSLKNTTTFVFGKPPPLKSANYPSPLLFRQFPPIYWFFMTSSPKNRIFQWTLLILRFFILNPIPSFKKLKLAKISQFKFLVMTEKNIFVYKSYSLFPNNLPLNPVKPFFLEIWSEVCTLPPPPPAEKGECTLCHGMFKYNLGQKK